MNIQELVDEATRIEPTLSLVVYDTNQYSSRKKSSRRVVVSAHSSQHGEGSGEDILLEMYETKTMLDQVRRVTPGRTTLHWQVASLIKAFDSLTVRDAHVPVE